MPELATGTEDSAGLAAADALARQILDLVRPLRVDIAGGEHELDSIYRLRFQVACEMGWISDDDGSRGLEQDAYDADAVHVGAWDGPQLVGTQRIVFPAPDRELPLERAFGLKIEPQGQVVHADRTAIARNCRGDRRHMLLAAIMSRSWLEWRSRGFHHCTGVITPRLERVYRNLGLEVEILGEAREYCGELRFPARFHVLAAAIRESIVAPG